MLVVSTGDPGTCKTVSDLQAFSLKTDHVTPACSIASKRLQMIGVGYIRTSVYWMLVLASRPGVVQLLPAMT